MSGQDKKHMTAEAQEKLMQSVAAKFGEVLPDKQAQDAISALLKDAAAGKIETVVASEIERMGVDPEEVKSVLSKLQEYGVKVIERKDEENVIGYHRMTDL